MKPTGLTVMPQGRKWRTSCKPGHASKRRQSGFSLVSAIFILVALTALGAAIVNVSTTQSITSAQDLQGSRAYHAARAGIEWGVYQVINPAGPIAPLPACPDNTTFTIDGFTVAVTCTRFPGTATDYNEVGTLRSIAVYELTSTASTGGTVGAINYVERQIRVTVSKCVTNETGVAALCS